MCSVYDIGGVSYARTRQGRLRRAGTLGRSPCCPGANTARHVCSNRNVLQARTLTREDGKALGQAFAAARETVAKAAGTLTDLSCAQSLKVRKNDGTKTTRLPEFELVTLLRRAGYWLVDEQQLPHARVVSEHQHVFLFASASLVLGDAGSFPPEKTKTSGPDARPRSPDRELSQDDVAQALRACAALLLESCRRNEAPAGRAVGRAPY